ncbi:3-methyladenine DNA glycosylase, partial [Lactobacillus rhamnosus]|nr:3-methyladenine DNA glycosylase [Lacticaseibacillus rhamnosus]
SLAPTDHRPRNIAVGPRIGIPNKEPWTSAPLRFYVAGNPFVSKIPRRDQDLEMRGWQS